MNASSTYQAQQAVALCIRRVQRATCGRGVFQAQRALLGALQRAGGSPAAAQAVADGALRVGKWLAGVHTVTVDAKREDRPPTCGGVTHCRVTSAVDGLA